MERADRLTRGQSTVEYAILISVVVAAFMGIAILVKNAIQGGVMERYRQVGQRFSPTDTVSTMISTAETHRRDFTTEKGVSRNEVLAPETTTVVSTVVVAEDVTGPIYR